MQQQGAVASPAASVQLLAVEVDGHRCGLPVEAVVEIHPAVQLAALPDAPDVVIGLMNRRGTALPVLDLRRRLGLPPRPTQLDDRLVVLSLPGRELAVQVDAAVDVLTVAASDLDVAAARSAQAVRSQGVAVLPDGLLVVLDLATFLSPGEAAALEAALRQTSPAAGS